MRCSENIQPLQSMIRQSSNTSESWRDLPWKKFRQNLFRLQKRVFKAVQAGDKKRASSLQKLILKSRAAKLLAVRQVTQLNAGKKTAGIDGKTALNYKERMTLAEEMNLRQWQHSQLREIPIPKKDGTTRMLKVPTIKDRAYQCLAKYALEPAHEATFHARSYGFRPGRSAHDAQKILFLNLSSSANGIQKRVIELDIEKCFDRISHASIMEYLIAPLTLKLGIFRCLKAGVNPEFPSQGTPQGGVVSPLLANIALNGIEAIHPSVRYADDMVIILKPEDNATKLLDTIARFLAERGMKLSERKTKITSTTDGFDFLGWHFQVQSNGKFRSTPSVENYKAFIKKVKAIVNSSNYGAATKAIKLAPIVRGWRNYHKFCKMDGSRFSLRYTSLRAWKVFSKEASVNRHQATSLKEKAFPAVSYAEHRHINVKGTKSPFDGDLTYWSERNSKLYDGLTAQILRKNHHRCEECGLKLTQDEEVHLHHIDGNHHNWSRNNLTVLHRSCHINLHNDKRSAERKTQKHINETKGAGNNPTSRTSGAGCSESGTPRSK